jgi:hypothetical protein
MSMLQASCIARPLTGYDCQARRQHQALQTAAAAERTEADGGDGFRKINSFNDVQP